MRAWRKYIFQNASVVLNFEQNLQTVTRIVKIPNHDPGDCLQVLLEIECHSRVLENGFAPRSHSGDLGSTILDDVDEKCQARPEHRAEPRREHRAQHEAEHGAEQSSHRSRAPTESSYNEGRAVTAKRTQ